MLISSSWGAASQCMVSLFWLFKVKTASGSHLWKWGENCTRDSNLWQSVTAPSRGLEMPRRRAWRSCQRKWSVRRLIKRDLIILHHNWCENGQNREETMSIAYRERWPKDDPQSCAAKAELLLATQLGQIALPLHERATILSNLHHLIEHMILENPLCKITQYKKRSNPCLTCGG